MSTAPACESPLVEAELRSLDRTLRALPEAAMRRERLLERLESAEAEEAYALVRGVVGRPGVPAPHLHHLREIMQDLLREGGAGRPLGHELRAAIYAAAADHDDAFVMRLFRSAGPAERMRDTAAALPRNVADIPLGMRRALARGVDLDLLERLLLDADPIVIEHLLENPRITEDHVVRIAAHRPIPASTLEVIQRSARFGPRPHVRTALARNPYCPTPLAIQLLGVLPRAEVRSMARDGTLHELVRQHAADELRRRDQG